MGILKWPTKDPDERLDYAMVWDAEMVTKQDSIIMSTWFVADGDDVLTIESEGVDRHRTYVWLSGGSLGATYRLTNRVQTAGGRIYDRSVLIMVAEK
jgi:hypothetical protein